MSEFRFKQAGVFHLKRMENIMRKRFDRRYRLSNDDDIKKLLWDAISENNLDLTSEFTLFFIHCWPETQNYICQNQLIPNLDAMMDRVDEEKTNLGIIE